MNAFLNYIGLTVQLFVTHGGAALFCEAFRFLGCVDSLRFKTGGFDRNGLFFPHPTAPNLRALDAFRAGQAFQTAALISNGQLRPVIKELALELDAMRLPADIEESDPSDHGADDPMYDQEILYILDVAAPSGNIASVLYSPLLSNSREDALIRTAAALGLIDDIPRSFFTVVAPKHENVAELFAVDRHGETHTGQRLFVLADKPLAQAVWVGGNAAAQKQES